MMPVETWNSYFDYFFIIIFCTWYMRKVIVLYDNNDDVSAKQQ